MEDLIISGKKYKSRLILGTGKYKSFEETAKAIKAAEVQIVTVAVRRVNVTNPKEPMLVDFLDPKKITYLPNTAGCYTAEEALRTLRLARDAGGWNLVKLEVLGDKETLYPNMIETIEALKVLKKENFEVMVYSSDDPILCKQLEDMGAAAIMPLGSLIGSGRGIQNRFNISIIKTQSKVPVIVDAGIGCASDAAIAMELGCDGVLINTAVAEAKNPILMAEAMKDAGVQIDVVLEIDVPDQDIISRMSGRRVHTASGRTYHVHFNPPKVEGKDDVTGEDLIQRDDDREETVRKRLEVYHAQTRQLVDYYGKWAASGSSGAPRYRKISGQGAVDAISERVLEALR